MANLQHAIAWVLILALMEGVRQAVFMENRFGANSKPGISGQSAPRVRGYLVDHSDAVGGSMSCLQTSRISGPCAKCGEPVVPCHLDERKLPEVIRELGGGFVTLPIYCAACCLNCTAQVSIDWEHAPGLTLRGEQEGLF